MGAIPSFLQPFVLPVEQVEPVREDGVDYYLPVRSPGSTGSPTPAVVLVHGGPVPPDLPERPPTWSAFHGYGSLAARAGAVGAVFEHSYHSPEDLDRAFDDVETFVARIRRHPSVDADRVLLWFFSGGGVLAGPFLSSPPDWLVGVALTYPMCEHRDDDGGSTLTTPVDAARAGSEVPVLFTRVEHERDWIEPSQVAFLAAADSSGMRVDVIDVPGAEHGFETIDRTDAARSAITAGLAWAGQRLATAGP
jgi:acetyl esterase/lipase